MPANIAAMMRNDASVMPGGYELLVPNPDEALARLIIEAYGNGWVYCPYCGSLSVRKIEPAMYQYILAIVSLALISWPATTMCENCGKKWG